MEKKRKSRQTIEIGGIASETVAASLALSIRAVLLLHHLQTKTAIDECRKKILNNTTSVVLVLPLPSSDLRFSRGVWIDV